jgi:hypothetical protein
MKTIESELENSASVESIKVLIMYMQNKIHSSLNASYRLSFISEYGLIAAKKMKKATDKTVRIVI